MVGRISLNADRVLITKSGFDTADDGGTLTDEQKIFDSRWAFSNFLLHSGYWTGHAADPASTTIVFPSSVGNNANVLISPYRWETNVTLSPSAYDKTQHGTTDLDTIPLSGTNLQKLNAFTYLPMVVTPTGFVITWTANGAYPFDWWVFANSET